VSLLDELPRGRWDIPFFAKTFLGIEVHPGQERFFEAIIARNATGWRGAYLTLCVSAGNRAGKTMAMAIAILHSCVYKINKRPPDWTNESDVRRWMREPYEWYHFGIEQEVADLVHAELVKIFESRHEAQQGEMCPLTDQLGPEIVQWEKKYKGDYPWIVLNEVLGGAQIHFRSTTQKALGSLGKAMNGVSMDECGFETNLPFLINEVFQFRRLSTGGQLFLISTPSEGFTDFADEHAKGDPDNPLRKPGHMSLYMSTEENVGYGIDKDMFDAVVASMPPELVPQNIHGRFIQGAKSFFNSAAVDAAFIEDLPERSPSQKERNYIVGMDPALTYDNTFGIAVDHTDRRNVRGVAIDRLRGKQTTEAVLAVAHDLHAEFNPPGMGGNCIVAVDVTGFGGKIFRDQLSGIPGLRGVEFGGSPRTKLKLLLDLKTMIERGHIKFPRHGLWLELRRQLLAYRLSDRKLSTDAVMALAIAVKLVIRTPAGASSSSLPFSFFAPEEPAPKGKQEEFWRNLRRRGTVQKIGTTI
jgi:hypothetical protein